MMNSLPTDTTKYYKMRFVFAVWGYAKIFCGEILQKLSLVMNPVFGTCEKNGERCFLQCLLIAVEFGAICLLTIAVHTMQVPYLNTPNVRMALVHHVDIPQAATGFGKPEEKIFVFVLGLKGIDIGMEKLLDALKLYWEATDEQRAAKEVAAEKVGLTPKLFMQLS
jgi:hypothetical protein